MVAIERLKELLHYDPATGVFTWKVTGSGKKRAGMRAGTPDKDGYRILRIDGRRYSEHRIAWFYMNGRMPERKIDHEDRVRSNNKYSNLRLATDAENCQNKVAKGYSRDKRTGRYRSVIKHNNKQIYLGTFDDEQSAVDAYLEKKKELHPFFSGNVAEAK